MDVYPLQDDVSNMRKGICSFVEELEKDIGVTLKYTCHPEVPTKHQEWCRVSGGSPFIVTMRDSAVLGRWMSIWANIKTTAKLLSFIGRFERSVRILQDIRLDGKNEPLDTDDLEWGRVNLETIEWVCDCTQSVDGIIQGLKENGLDKGCA